VAGRPNGGSSVQQGLVGPAPAIALSGSLTSRWSRVIPNGVRDQVVLATVRGQAAQIPRKLGMTIRGAVADNRSLSRQRSVVSRRSSVVPPPSPFVGRPSSFVRRPSSLPLRPSSFVLRPSLSVRLSPLRWPVIPNGVRDQVVLATVRGDAAQIPRKLGMTIRGAVADNRSVHGLATVVGGPWAADGGA
jgi:hypothetical protein